MLAFQSWPIRHRLLATFLSVIAVLGLVQALATRWIVRKATADQVRQELDNTSRTLANLVETTVDASITAYLRGIAEKNAEVVEGLAHQAREGKLSRRMAQERAASLLLAQHIGTTGYVYALDSRGIIQVHPRPEVLGQDLTRHAFIQEQLRRHNGFLEYMWANPGESRPRAKVLYMVHVPEWDWIVSVTSYRDEFHQLLNLDDFRKRFLDIRFGKTGYPYLMDGKGTLLIHPSQEGQNIRNSRDAGGRAFIEEVLARRNGVITYPWKNPGEPTDREKLVVFRHLPELDWIVASTCYLNEFHRADRLIFWSTGTAVLLSLVLGSLLTLNLSRSLTRPLETLASQVALAPLVGGGDEVARLTSAFKTHLDALEEGRQKLERSEQRYRGLFESAIVGIFEADPQGHLRSANPALATLLGFAHPDLLIQEGRLPFAVEEEGEALWGLLDVSGEVRNHPLLLRDTSGRELWVEIFARKGTRDLSAPVEGMVLDITQRHAAETELRRLTAIHTLVLEHSTAGIALVRDRRFQWVNPCLADLLGHAVADIQGSPTRILFCDDASYELVGQASRANFAENRPYDGEIATRDCNGEARWLRLLGTPVPGEVNASIWISTDITAQKLADEERLRHREHLEELVDLRTRELASARDEAVAATRAKTMFLASMTHELRTPIHAVMGFTQILLHTLQDSESRAQLQRIHRAGEHLLGLINDVLSVSRIESGRLELHPGPFELGPFLDDLQAMMAVRAQAKGLHFEVARRGPIPVRVQGDALKLRQVLVNLLGNAIKFTLRGEVRLVVQAADAGMAFTIVDTGVGMSQDELRNLFQPFQQGSHGAAIAEGTGLGLYISRAIIKAMGGTLDAERQEAGGMAFHVIVPLESLPETPGTPSLGPGVDLHLAQGQKPPRMLAVDDLQDNLDLLRSLFLQSGLDIDLATSGEQALDMIRKGPYDVLWTDLRMPGLDGPTLLARIREQETELGRPPVVAFALTAGALDVDPGSLLAAGFSAWAFKPFGAEVLRELLTRHLGLVFTGEASTPSPLPQPPSLADQPEPWKADLRLALLTGDEPRILQLLETFPNPAQGQVLLTLAREYQFERLLSLLEEAP